MIDDLDGPQFCDDYGYCICGNDCDRPTNTPASKGETMSKPAIALSAILGFKEFRSGFGRSYGDARDEAYDFGRDLAHRLTFRVWDW